jgi:hypothetical protein
VKIRQMCCGVLVGIREAHAPQSEGTLQSPRHRRYHFVHRVCEYGTGIEVSEHTANTRPQTAATSGTAAAAEAAKAADFHPQVGLVEISTVETRARLNQLSLQQSTLHQSTLLSPHPVGAAAGPPAGPVPMAPGSQELGDSSFLEPIVHKEANLRFLDAAALKAAFTRGWPPIIATDAPAGPTTAAGAGGASVAGSLASALHPGTSHVRSIVQQGRLRVTPQLYSLAQDLLHQLPSDAVQPALRPAAVAMVTQPDEPFVAEIKRAMDIICRREKDAFLQCHELFLRQDAFPLPIAGGINVERCLLAATTFVLSKFAPQTRAVCKVPSSFVVRFVWEHLERQATKLVKPADAGGSKAGDASEALLAEFVAANMSGDANYFVRVLRSCFELQLIVEYQAYSRGMLDGAER